MCYIFLQQLAPKLPMKSSMLDSILDIIIPKYCVGCKKLNCFICSKCYEKIEFFSSPVPLKIEPCYLDKLWVMGKYSSPLSNLIKTYKYKKVKNIGKFLAKMMHYTMSIPYKKYYNENNTNNCKTIVTSVPLHTKKFKQRGFNQAEIIAKNLAIILSQSISNIYYKETLIRTKHSAPQVSMKDREKRISRLANTYSIIPDISDIIKNSTIFLIDDVSTTGATLNETAKILKKNGAKTIIGLVVAHG